MVDIKLDIKDRNVAKSYAHFDRRVMFAEVEHLVTNKDFVSHYAFYPLIQRDLRRMKPDGSGGFKNDPREIRYAAHMDRCIYQYYAALLNERYNVLAADCGIDESSIAYRTNLRGKSNCDFARMAFDRVRELGTCCVYAGDFRHFFEALSHRNLKRRVRLLFNDGVIPDDYYHVLNNATRYSVWPIEDLLERHGLPLSKTGVKRLNQRIRVLSPNEFKDNVKKMTSRPWKKDDGVGIPQGLPISGVLANIYMIEFDRKAHDLATSIGGMYLRYSDDFIFIFPKPEDLIEVMAKVAKLAVDAGITIHADKTHACICKPGLVVPAPGVGAAAGRPRRQIDYLGFTYDGTCVRLRQRTIGRYYRRLYHRIGWMYGDGNRPSRKRFYSLYVDFANHGRRPEKNERARKLLGKRGKHGNFLTYVDRAQRVFPHDPISRDTDKHMQKIRKRCKVLSRRAQLGRHRLRGVPVVAKVAIKETDL